MADHFAEQILAAFKTTLSGLTTTGTRVERSRVYDLEEDSAPGLSIFMGEDIPPAPGEDGDIYPFIDPVLQVIVRCHVQASSGDLDTTINLIRKEVAVALNATTKLGLSTIVIDFWEGASEPVEPDSDGQKRSVMHDTSWFVKYRRSITDPSA